MCNGEYSPLVSIVIPAYNASNYLTQAIDCALAQTYKDVEIIVVNDGSRDDGATERIALSYGDKIRYFSKENGGSSSALNCGIENMKGEWFSWLSHDDLYYPEKLQKQIEYLNSLSLEENEIKRQVLFTGSELIDANGGIIRSPKKEKLLATEKKMNGLKGNEYLIAEPTENFFHGCGCLVHRSVFESIGCFDEKLRLLNDVDMWYRIYAAGYTVRYVPEILVQGRVHAKQVSTQIGYSYHNPEQDMFWKRSLDWLLENHPNDYALYFMFGRNAYLKTRNADGDRSFEYAVSLKPKTKSLLQRKKTKYKLYASLRSIAKKVYLKIKKR